MRWCVCVCGWQLMQSVKAALKEPALANQLADALTVVLRTGGTSGGGLSGGDASFVSRLFGGVAASDAASPRGAASPTGILPQLRAAAKGHFGAHWRSSVPNEWDAPDLLLLLQVAAEERFAKERAQVC